MIYKKTKAIFKVGGGDTHTWMGSEISEALPLGT
jgi:hypothetical protein